jgi:hypothetical protein
MRHANTPPQSPCRTLSPSRSARAFRSGWDTTAKGDWIIQGVKGEIYPCKPDSFAATYEAVNHG